MKYARRSLGRMMFDAIVCPHHYHYEDILTKLQDVLKQINAYNKNREILKKWERFQGRCPCLQEGPTEQQFGRQFKRQRLPVRDPIGAAGYGRGQGQNVTSKFTKQPDQNFQECRHVTSFFSDTNYIRKNPNAYEMHTDFRDVGQRNVLISRRSARDTVSDIGRYTYSQRFDPTAQVHRTVWVSYSRRLYVEQRRNLTNGSEKPRKRARGTRC